MARIHAVCIAGLLLAGCATVTPRPDALTVDCAALAGPWAGSLLVAKATGPGEADDELKLRLVFAGDVPRVYIEERGHWMEAKPGSFRSRCLGPTAIVHALDSGRDDDGTWVEGWTLTVTTRDADSLLARWTRVVNNIDSKKAGKFASGATGVLERVKLPSAR
jgi:hypothetical protein